ncbi:hypothetical protein KJ682_03970 [bacterium]|nr:hypothetical protein [bacterium]
MKSMILMAAALILAALLSVPAQAQIIDTRSDVIGFFLDPVGNVPGACVPYQNYSAYLMITRPSDDSGLTAYQCTFIIPPVVQSLGYQPAGGIIIQDTFPRLDIFYSTPLPWANEVYILGNWNFFLLTHESDWVLLADHFTSEWYSAAYRTVASAGARIPVSPPDWANGMISGPPLTEVVFWLNEACGYVVDDETVSWGGVKGLFR